MTNPMDGHNDIYPWPWHWSRDIDPSVISKLTLFSAFWPVLDYWTYDNHWAWSFVITTTPPERCVDIYWRDEDDERLQLPPGVGDILAPWLVNARGDDLVVLLWDHQVWTEELGWREYTGPQGDFVDHIHTEWKEDT